MIEKILITIFYETKLHFSEEIIHFTVKNIQFLLNNQFFGNYTLKYIIEEIENFIQKFQNTDKDQKKKLKQIICFDIMVLSGISSIEQNIYIIKWLIEHYQSNNIYKNCFNLQLAIFKILRIFSTKIKSFDYQK